MRTPFTKRTYSSLGEWLRDLAFVVKNRKRVRAITRHKAVDPAFRERMMLAVTRVNRCRYCAYFHTKLALTEGVPKSEIDTILGGEYKDCPPDQLPAILYAEHWADTQGRPDPEARRKLIETYGLVAADNIDLVLRIIKTGNYTGNTVDYLLYRISFGRWGVGR